MSLSAVLSACIALVVRLVEPPPDARAPLAFARTLHITEGPDQGTIGAPRRLGDDPHPAQEAALRWALRWPRFVVLAPPQDGKDTGICVPLILWSLIEYRRPAVYATADKHLGAKLYRAKVRAPLTASGYSWALPDEGSGSEGGTPDDILFRTGARLYLLGAGASNGAGQAGITAWLVVVTEADKVRADQLTWIEDRNEAYADDKRTVLVGTLDRYDGKGLWVEHEHAVKARMYHPCPRCGHWQTFDWDRVTYDAATHDPENNDTARIACAGCAAPLCEAERHAAALRSREVFEGQDISPTGEITGSPKLGPSGAIRWTALDSPRRRLGRVCARHLDAIRHYDRTGEDSRLREFFLKELTMPPADRRQALYLRETDLAQRSALSAYARGEIPDGVDLVVITVDIQLRRILWLAFGFNMTSESWWIIAYGSIAVCGDGDEPTKAQRHAALDKVQSIAQQGWPRADGFLVRATVGGVDTGDGNTRDEVLGWLHRRPGWYALKGQGLRQTNDHAAGEAIFRLPGVLSIHRQSKTSTPHDLFAINVDALKARIYRAFTHAPGTPGAGHLPHGEAADGALIRQLCAERQEQTDGEPVWVQRYRHNHYLDDAVYALALVLYLAHLRTLRGSAAGVDAAEFARRLGGG